MNPVSHLIRWSVRDGTAAALIGPTKRRAVYAVALLLATQLASCDVPATTSEPKTDNPAPPPSPSTAGLVILPAEVSLDEGSTSQLRVFERMPDGGAGREVSAGITLTWTTSDGSVASIERGLVNASEIGTARITVSTSDSRTATADVKVVREVARIEVIAGGSQIGRVGTKLDGELVAKLTSKLGRPVEGAGVGFAVISGGGATSVKDVTTGPDGIARTEWTLGPVAGEQAIEIRLANNADLARRVVSTAGPGPVAQMSVQPSVISLQPGSTMQIEVIAEDAYGNPIPEPPVLWSTDNPSIAQVSSSGVLTANTDGETQVIATLDASANAPAGMALSTGTFSGKARITVGQLGTFSISYEGDNQTGTVATRLPKRLRIKVVNPLGKPVSNLGVSWVVTSGGGSMSATQTKTDSYGRAEVYWTLGSRAGDQTAEARPADIGALRFNATALAAPVTQLSVSPSTSRVRLGESLRYQAVATDRYGNVRSTSASWSSLDPATATVSSDGVAKGMRSGRTSVRAVLEGVSSSGTLDVTTDSTNVPPSAAFTVSCNLLVCDFTDASTDSDGSISTRTWTFGDGGTMNATSTTVRRTYAVAGTFNVTLRVADNVGASTSTSKSITISGSSAPSSENKAPVASFTSSCTALSCSFTDTSTDSDGSVTERTWGWGDGTAATTSTSKTASHTFSAGGTYTVTLQVTDDKGATGGVSKQVQVSAPSTPSGSWDRVIEDQVINGDVVVPDGQKWLIGRNVEIKGNLRTVGGTIAMRPGSSLKFLGADPARYVGGGMTFSDQMANDIGLWVGPQGMLDIQCTPKTGWNRTGVDPSWKSTDEYWITPTASRDFKPRRWYPGQPVPRVDSRVPAAEVLNVTRDCTITGPAHIHIHSTRAQRIEYVRLQNMGVGFKPNAGGQILGRYALHLHMSGDGTRGTIIRGVAAVGSGARVFVPHSSHGVTMIDNVSVNSLQEALWWDIGHDTNDLLVDRMAVLGVNTPREMMNTTPRFDGYMLGSGLNMEVRNSVVSGVWGDKLTVGFNWVSGGEAPNPLWTFERGNVAHNNEGPGLRFWTNGPHEHVVRDYVSYRNGIAGIENGAYLNAVAYHDVVLFQEGDPSETRERAAILWHVNGRLGSQLRNATVISASGPALRVGNRQLSTPQYSQFSDCTLTAPAGQPKILVDEGNSNTKPWKANFVRCDVTPNDIVFQPSEYNEGSDVLLEHNDGRKWRVQFLNGQKVVTNR